MALLHDLLAVVLIMQTDGKSGDQSNEANDDNHCYDTDPPPSPYAPKIYIIPQVAQFFSPVVTFDIP